MTEIAATTKEASPEPSLHSNEANSEDKKKSTDSAATAMGCLILLAVPLGLSYFIYREFFQVPRVLIETIPSGAKTFIDGKMAGETPFYRELPTGERRLRFERRGYEPYEKLLDTTKQTTLVQYELVAIPATQQELSNTADRLDSISTSIGMVEGRLKSLLAGDSITSAEYMQQLVTLKEDVDGLKSVMTDDPMATLAVPLMKKDLDNVRLANERQAIDISRIYDGFYWFSGTIIAVMLSAMGFVYIRTRAALGG